jgi:ceramide glucosyltransferase
MDVSNWAAAFCVVSTGFHLTSLAVTTARLRRNGWLAPSPTGEPAVSLLRPVCGIDNFATETLASTFDIDYPNYEIIFCVARADDPVVAILHRLIDAHPEVPARLLVGDDRIGANPKLNNLIKGWEAAQHQWIIVADSNVLMPRDYIRRLLARWCPDTGVVCSMPVGARPHNFWAEIECAFLNTLQARYQYVSESLGCGFAQGKTTLFRRDIVERGGGIRVLAAETAEDAATTKMVRSLGLRVHLVDSPFEQPLGWRTATEVWSRQLRWARLRRASFPWLFLPEIFLGSALPTLAVAVAASGYGLSVPTAVATFLVLWFAAEIALAEWAGWHRSLGLAAALPVRDLLLPVLWIGALLGTDFVWRGNEMTVGERQRQRNIAAEEATRPVRSSPGHIEDLSRLRSAAK